MIYDIQQLRQFKVLVIGDACIDVYNYGVCNRISSEAPIPIIDVKTVKTQLGMALNVCNNLNTLNINTISTTNDANKIKKTRFIDVKSNQQLLRVDSEECTSTIDYSNINTLDINDFDALVISDYCKGTISKEITDIISSFNMQNKLIFVDTKKRDLSIYNNTIIKINRDEYDNVHTFPENYELVVTLGKDGAMYNNNVISTIPTDVYSIVGAGDTFFAGFICATLNELSRLNALYFANMCATTVVMQHGTSSVNTSTLQQLLQTKIGRQCDKHK